MSDIIQNKTNTIVVVCVSMISQWLQNGIAGFMYCFNRISKLLGLNKEIGSMASRNKNRLKSIKEIPGPISLPLFGTTLTSSALRLTDYFKANEERLIEFGPIVKEEHFWGFPMIHILDADLIEKAVKAVGSIRPGMEILSYYRNLRPDRYDCIGLTNAQGKEWEKLHSALSPLLTSPKFIQSLTQTSDEMAVDFLKLIRKLGPCVENTQQLVRKFVAETAFYNVFGKRMGFMWDDETVPSNVQAFLENHDRLWAALHETTYGLPWWKYFPTKLWKRNTNCEDYLLDVVEDLIQTFIKENSTTTHNAGFLGPLLESKEVSYKTKRLLTLETIMGSSDSVISTITFMLYWITSDQQVVTKLFEELKTLFPSKDTELDADKLHKLPYLKACMMECYRMTCIAPNVMRITENPLELGGYFIPPYSLLILQWSFAARNEKSFYKPEQFLPERWIYEDGTPKFKPHKRNIMYPFGFGKRACPGSRVVKLHIPILLARVLRNFDVTCEGACEPKCEWIIQPAHPVRMNFRERSDEE